MLCKMRCLPEPEAVFNVVSISVENVQSSLQLIFVGFQYRLVRKCIILHERLQAHFCRALAKEVAILAIEPLVLCVTNPCQNYVFLCLYS